MNQGTQKLFWYAPGILICALLLTAGCSKHDARNPIYDQVKAQCPAANAGNPDAIRDCEQVAEAAAANCVKDPTPEQERKCTQVSNRIMTGANSDWAGKNSFEPPMPTAPRWSK